MGMECGECEQDLRAGHHQTCSRYRIYRVARMKDGVPHDWLHSFVSATDSHMCCINPAGAMTFEIYDDAADAAGWCMDQSADPNAEYRVIEARS